MRVVLQPCGNKDSRKHYLDTIENTVKFDDHPELSELTRDLERYFPEKTAPLWGVTPGKNNVNVKKYNKVGTGDVVLFSKDNKIFASGTIVKKIHSEPLAERLWGRDKDGATWEYMYILDEIRSLAVTYSEFNSIVGYADNYVIQGFNVLDEDKSNRVIEYIELSSSVYSEEISDEEIEDTLLGVGESEPLDVVAKTKVRREQSLLRRGLFKGSGHTSTCHICGKEFPLEFLVAAHIKKRQFCTREEKLDHKNIVMAACKMGCDEAFERGIVVVDNEGIIRAGRVIPATAAITAYLDGLIGNKCLAWSEFSKNYFDWHHNYFLPTNS